MTKINHRRKNRKNVNKRHSQESYHNGYPSGGNGSGNTGFLDKSMHSWGRSSEFADVCVGASIGNDFCNGNRGMAKAVKGAKKFVRSRIRFHEKSALNRIIRNPLDDGEP